MFTILLTLCLASSAFAAEPVNVITRGLVDMAITLVESMLGFSLTSLWTTIADIGGAIYAQFILIMTNLVFAGQQVIAQVAPIFAQLAVDIVNHVAEASIYIEAAFQQIATIMNINLFGKREVASYRGLVNWAFEILLASVEQALGFSLQALWTAVQAAGQAMVNQFIMIVTALATATTPPGESITNTDRLFRNLVQMRHSLSWGSRDNINDVGDGDDDDDVDRTDEDDIFLYRTAAR